MSSKLMQSSNSFKKYCTEFISFLLIMLFVYAAVSKLLDFQQFKVQLGQSPILSHFSGWVSWTVPTAEIIISILIAIPVLRMIGLYASFTLMVIFTAYIFSITHFSSYVPCSCGGILEHMNWNQHFLFNLLFVAITLTGLLAQESMLKTKQFKAG